MDDRAINLLLFLLFLALEFLVRWKMDTPFVRRANIFLPYVALLAAYGLQTFFKRPLLRRLTTIGVVTYTLGLAIVSQYNFWNDTRYRSRVLHKEQLQSTEKVKYTMYEFERQMPKQSAKTKAEEYIA